MLTEEQQRRFLAVVNQRMQGTYEAALGSSPRAHDISDSIGSGVRYAVLAAMEDAGIREADR